VQDVSTARDTGGCPDAERQKDAWAPAAAERWGGALLTNSASAELSEADSACKRPFGDNRGSACEFPPSRIPWRRRPPHRRRTGTRRVHAGVPGVTTGKFTVSRKCFVIKWLQWHTNRCDGVSLAVQYSDMPIRV
jgi:hypothetical protein